MPIGAADEVKDGCLLELDINEEMVIEKLQKMRQDNLSILVNTFTSLRTTKITFLIWS